MKDTSSKIVTSKGGRRFKFTRNINLTHKLRILDADPCPSTLAEASSHVEVSEPRSRNKNLHDLVFKTNICNTNAVI